jgi:hypothetical protein
MAIEDEQTEDLNNESSDLLGREGFKKLHTKITVLQSSDD